MSEIDWALVSEIFADALEVSPADREAFVAARCTGRPDLRAAVHRMLAARDEADPAFLTSVSKDVLDEVAAARAAPLERIGPWRIVREIGRGGMGQVFLAERADGQFEQQVAIKLLKRGMDSDAILTRFLRERQILAQLDHPNIARLMDGGVADDGRPYFVMEYVDGLTITAYADAHRLTIEARLALFRTVCVAVEYAHRNLVVHRDLKPSNILVTHDGRPKLLDFGIAKLLASPDDKAEAATLTSHGVRLLTPDYAAPEQFQGGPITTATDVYGLGAVLYQLLAGRPPFDAETRHGAERALEAEPVPLSTAPFRATLDDDDAPGADAVAELRGSDAARLRRRLSGDLDTIVASALRATPERRYASVGALHDDIRRHLERLPVLARPDSLGYRASRFVRRHRAAVVAGGAVAVLLAGFGVSTALQARALAAERDRARREAATAREVAEFLEGVFEVANPMTPGQGGDVRAADLLDRGATRIETDLAGQPAVQARLLGVIGSAYANLERRARAIPLLERSVELHRATGGPDSPELATALQRLARVLASEGDSPRAEAAAREAIGIHQRVAPDDAGVWRALVDLAYVLHSSGDNEKGQATLTEAIALFNSLPADRLDGSRDGLLLMADLLRFSRESTYTDTVFTRLVQVERSAAGPNGIPVATAMTAWASAKERRGDLAAAESLYTDALRIHAASDPTSLGTAAVLYSHASLSMQRREYARADSQARAALRIFRDRLGEDHRQVAIARATHADILQRSGRYEESIETRRLVLAAFARDSTDARVLLPTMQWRFGIALRETGRWREAIAAFDSALRAFEARFPANYILSANVRRDYGDLLVDAGRAAEAEPMLRRAIEVLGARWGKDDVRTDAVRISLGRALVALGRRSEAGTMLAEVEGRLSASRGASDSLTQRARKALDTIGR